MSAQREIEERIAQFKKVALEKKTQEQDDKKRTERTAKKREQYKLAIFSALFAGLFGGLFGALFAWVFGLIH